MNGKTRIYLAAPLFSEQEIQFNTWLANEIRETGAVVYNPCENEAINDKTKYANAKMIADGDNAELDKADILVALLDGQTMDVGVAAEIGRFSMLNKPIVALFTDSRQGTHGNQDKINALDVVGENQFQYVNLYVTGLIKNNGVIVQSSFELLTTLEGMIQ